MRPMHPMHPMVTPLERGLVTGLLIGEGHFGPDGRQAQVAIAMHVRHEPLLRWLTEVFPQTALYGPYDHSGRSFLRWVARGPALVEDVLPVVGPVLETGVDPHVLERYRRMCTLCAGNLRALRARTPLLARSRTHRTLLDDRLPPSR